MKTTVKSVVETTQNTLNSMADMFIPRPQLVTPEGFVFDEVPSYENGVSYAKSSESSAYKTSDGESSSISDADNIADATRLKEYYKQAEKYGTGSIKELENGRFRFYEEIKPARTNGEMAGARHLREWALLRIKKRLVRDD